VIFLPSFPPFFLLQVAGMTQRVTKVISSSSIFSPSFSMATSSCCQRRTGRRAAPWRSSDFSSSPFFSFFLRLEATRRLKDDTQNTRHPIIELSPPRLFFFLFARVRYENDQSSSGGRHDAPVDSPARSELRHEFHFFSPLLFFPSFFLFEQ